MARAKRLSEIVGMLKRRLVKMDRYTMTRVTMDLRDFAVANEFYCYVPVDRIVSEYELTQPLDRGAVERAIRTHSKRKI